MSSVQKYYNIKPRSDEDLQKLTVGELKPHNTTISLVEYDPRWPELFRREANRVRSVLGSKALQIEHVGSTSVPGLCAKPIIDMLLVVKNSADEPSYVPALETAGYTLRIREPEWFEHRLFKGPDTDINLHVFSEGASEIDRMLRFRDWLRSNESDRDKYAQVKRNLAKNKWRHVQHYADAKTSIVQEIMERATVETKMNDHLGGSFMGIEKVKQYFSKWNIEDRIQEFDVSSATVELAAKALNCEPERIAKTLAFKVNEKPILIVTAGDAKIDNKKYKKRFGAKAKMLSPEEVVELIGYEVGGVCPFGINEEVAVYLDESLKRFETVFPACGSSNSAIELSISELGQYSGCIEWIDVCKLV